MINNKFCKFCSKQIEENKLASHEYYCERNFIKCEKCGRRYDPNEQNQHEQQFHNMRKCDICKDVFYDFTNHVCYQNNGQCTYCQVRLPQNEIHQHMKYCINRLQPCPYCNKDLYLHDLIGNKRVCPQLKQEGQKPKSFVITELQNNEKSNTSSNQVPNLPQTQIQHQQDTTYPQTAYQILAGKQFQKITEQQQPFNQNHNQEYLFQQSNRRTSNPNLDQIQIQDQIQMRNNRQEFQSENLYQLGIQNPIQQQNFRQDFSQYNAQNEMNFPYNLQAQQNYINNQQNLNQFLEKVDNQEKSFQQLHNYYKHPAQDQQLQSPIQVGIHEYLQNRFIPNQTIQNQTNQNNLMGIEFQQQENQDNFIEDLKLNKKDYEGNIIGTILYESIQADIQKIKNIKNGEKYQFQEQQNLKQQQANNPNDFNRNIQNIIETEFDFLSDEEKQLQIIQLQILQQQQQQWKNQRR